MPPTAAEKRRTAPGGPTAPEERPIGDERRAVWIRRLLVVVLVVVVAAALAGAFGIHARTASATGGGYHLDVRYAGTARPGVSVPLEVEVTRDGGFGGPVQLALSSSYLDALHLGSVLPEPSESSADDRRVLLSFDPTEGSDALLVTLQAEVDPSTDAGRHRGEVSVLDSGTAVATASFTSWVWP